VILFTIFLGMFNVIGVTANTSSLSSVPLTPMKGNSTTALCTSPFFVSNLIVGGDNESTIRRPRAGNLAALRPGRGEMYEFFFLW